MGAVIFSDVHADSEALATMASCIRQRSFHDIFGGVDVIINLGDLLQRGDRPKETLEMFYALSREFHLISVLGNHDHAFLNGISVSGSDAASSYRHEQLRGSPLLAVFEGMPMEWVEKAMLFVHGGPLDLGSQTLRLKCWQRLSREAGDSFTGYHYTAPMAFAAIRARGLAHMCCGHQHEHLCCRNSSDGIQQHPIEFSLLSSGMEEVYGLEVATIPCDVPTLFRVGGCHGDEPEFAYTDFTSFSYIRIKNRD